MTRPGREVGGTEEACWLDILGIEPAALASARPVYRALAQAIETAITGGAVRQGTRLPPERLLAELLGLSRTTVVQAYRELERRGLVRGHVGRGTYVSAMPDPESAPFAWRGKVAATALRSHGTSLRDLMGDAAEPHRLSTAVGTPALDVFPVEAVSEALDRAMRRYGAAVWTHGPTQGQDVLRAHLAARYGTAPSQTLVLSGAQQGLDLVARCLVDPGDVVIIDRPGYPGAIHAFREAGARLHGWDVVRGDLDELDDLLLRSRPKLIYTNPTFQNPTGWTMPVRTRRAFLAVASRYRVPVVEDDTYRELYLGAAGPPTLQSMDPHACVIHLNSFGKVLAPGLRLGWLSAAEPIIDHLSALKQRADPQTQNLVQFLVADLLDSGAYDAHLGRLRVEHRRRSQAAAAAIQRAIRPEVLRLTAIPSGGLYFWCRLAADIESRDLLRSALPHGVAFVPGHAFYADPAGAHELRICFATIRPSDAESFGQRLAASLESARGILSVRDTLNADHR